MIMFTALIGAFVLFGQPAQPPSTSQGTGNLSIPFPGTFVSLDTARSMVSFQIGVPTYLPRAFAHTAVRVDPSYPMGGLVYLIYSSVPFDDNTTMADLLGAGGFFIVETHEPATDPGPIIEAVVKEQAATKVTINGNPGFSAGNQLHWWALGIHYAIVSPFPQADMVAIANSVAP
ncbi:MAG TPA: hypothetical protein HA326_08435 [Thermoplasmata archaeon]|nr:hypothetical protein [Thermoplasmata archaeon]